MFNHPKFNVDEANKNLDDMKELHKTKEAGVGEIKAAWAKVRKGKPFPLSDDELLFMIAGVMDQEDAKTYAEIIESRVTGDEDEADGETESEKDIKSQQEGFVIDRNTAIAMERSAKNFIQQVDEGFFDTMMDVQLAAEKTTRGIAIMLCDRLYGENKWGDNVWSLIPDPRITPKEAKAMQGKNDTLLPRWTYKDGARARVGDWFETVVVGNSEGFKLKKMIEDIEVGGTDVKGKTPEQQAYANMDSAERGRLLSQMEKRLDNIVNRFKRMVKLYLVMKEINNYHKTVKCELIRQVNKEDGEFTNELTNTLECLVVWKVRVRDGHPIKNESFIPNTFLRLDVSKVDKAVAEKDGYYEALLQTKDREPTNKEGYDVPESIEAYLGFINTLETYYTNETALMAFNKKWANTTDEKERLEIAETHEDVYMKIGGHFNVTRKWLEDYRAAQEEAKKTTIKAA